MIFFWQNEIESLASSAESLYDSPDDDADESDDDDVEAEDDADTGGQNFRSTARIRGLLESVVNKVINKSQTNLVSSGQVKRKKFLC